MSRHPKQWQSVARLSTLIAALASCVAVATSVRAAEHVVEILAFKFVPDRLAVKTGDKITWVNRDIAPHTATAADRSWDTKRLKKGESVSIAVTDTMQLGYFCRFHPHMKATLVLDSD